jgi:hypothetical protein
MRGRTWAALITAAALTAAPAADARGVDIEALSSRPDQVSGGDALVRVEAPDGLLRKLRVARNGEDVTDALDRRDGALIGLVDGLELGRNSLVVTVKSRTLDRLSLINYPTTGPIFSGPHQGPFVCKTIQAGLGEPIVDNQEGEGFRVLRPDGSTAG